MFVYLHNQEHNIFVNEIREKELTFLDVPFSLEGNLCKSPPIKMGEKIQILARVRKNLIVCVFCLIGKVFSAAQQRTSCNILELRITVD
jgi:hypothetical protein